MGKAKNYYNVDLFNIEEILSLLEMEDYVGSSAHKQAYLEYLRDVVKALTPTFGARDRHDTWQNFQPSNSRLAAEYAAFVATLFGFQWETSEDRHYSTTRLQFGPRYSVITLNYDLVLENTAGLINKAVSPQVPLEFAASLEAAGRQTHVPLAKLHGSVDPLTIVPPTWNKVANEEVMEAWKLAYRLLADATQIRFVGYSLPASDTYVRYLLASAVLESKHLKRVDAICLDPTEVVESRYRALITYYKFRFRSADIVQYFYDLHTRSAQGLAREVGRLIMKFDKLEDWHEQFMRQS